MFAAVSCDEPGGHSSGGPGSDSSATTSTQNPPPVERREVSPTLLTDAEELVAAARFDEAIELLEAVVDDARPNGRAELLYALSQHKLKRYARARPWFEAAQRAEGDWNGRDAVPYYLGWCLYNLGELDAARAAFEAHLERVPGEGDSWFGLGVIALDAGRMDAAREAFEQAIEKHRAAIAAGRGGLDADLAKSLARLAEVARLEDRVSDARDALLESVRVYPAHYVAWYQLHEVLLELGENQAASEALAQHDAWRERVRGSGSPEPTTVDGGN